MKQPFRVRGANWDGGFSRDDARVVQLVQVMHAGEVGPVLATLVRIDCDVRMFGRACVPQPHEDEQAQRKRGGGACGTAQPLHFYVFAAARLSLFHCQHSLALLLAL